VRHEIADGEDVRGAEPIARPRALGQRRGNELGTDRDADGRHPGRVDPEPLDDGVPRVRGVGNDRASASGVEPRGRGERHIAKRSAAVLADEATAIADEVEVMDREHDGAGRGQGRLVVGREKHVRAVARQRAR
jgi:hypothetical protein